MVQHLRKKKANAKLSTKFMVALSVILVFMTVLDIYYNVHKETEITHKAVKEWTFLFGENIRVALNTLMREGKMDARFSLFKAMSKELKGLKDVRVIRSERVDEIFQEINEKEVVPPLRQMKEVFLQSAAKLELELAQATDPDEKAEFRERRDDLRASIRDIDHRITELLKVKETDPRERPRDELDQEVLEKGLPLYLFNGDNARALIPYTVRKEGCTEEDGCHVYAKEGDVLGAVSLEFSVKRINDEIRQNNVKMAGVWVIRFIIFLTVISLLLTFIITRNLHNMLGVFGKMSGGDLSVRAPVKSEDEIGKLAQGFNRMANSLEETKNELDRRLLEIYALYNVSKTLNASFETEQLLLKLVKDISKSMDIDRMMVMLLDKKSDDLKIASYTGFKEKEIESIHTRMDEGLYGKAASTGTSKVIECMEKDKSVRPEDIINPNINSLIAVPFLRRGEVLGLICAFKDKPARFRQSDVNLFNNVAEHLAIALENARLFEKTKKMAITDGLTGLYNKRFFTEVLESEINRAQRCEHDLSVFMMDIDNFKHYNDTNGHPAGDALLKELAKLIKSSIRKIDIPCRYGGEEFIVILPETDKQGAKVVAENLIEKIHNHAFPYREKQPLGFVSASMGLASYPVDSTEIDELIEKVDLALYEAKNNGKNRVVVT